MRGVYLASWVSASKFSTVNLLLVLTSTDLQNLPLTPGKKWKRTAGAPLLRVPRLIRCL